MGWRGRADRRREADFAPLYATGKPFWGNCGFAKAVEVTIILRVARWFELSGLTDRGGVMDLAMAMGVALFGMFAVSTVYFFYKLD
ncbi:hypothetical protein D0B32_16490 [Paraburkholderia sp. DHOC27]|nr:hypothetical protein D0B32_16490 [Paraburkholderia sp. DHOC27]